MTAIKTKAVETTAKTPEAREQASPSASAVACPEAFAAPLSGFVGIQRAAGNMAVQRRARSSELGLTSEEVQRAANAGFAGAGRPLPHRRAIQQAFGPAHDLSDVRAYVGGSAAEAGHALNARAYASGNQIAFESEPDLPLAAHEAAHVVQQRGGVQLAGNLSRPGDPYEQQAEAVADRVAAGESAAHLLVFPTLTSSASRPVQRQPTTDAPPAPAAPSGFTEQVRAAMNQPDPIAGVGDFPAAFRILNGLAMFDILRTLTELDATGELDLLTAHFNEATGVNRNRLLTAIHVVRVKHPHGERPTLPEIDQYAEEAGSLPPDQQGDIIQYLMGGLEAADVARFSREGAAVAGPDGGASTGTPDASPNAGMSPDTANALLAAGAMIGPGMFRPGDQPVSFYLGILAHLGIAAFYMAEHAGDQVFTNFTSVVTIISALARAATNTPPTPMAPTVYGPPSPDQLAAKPDIANMTRRHLYEIKPQSALAQAEAEAEWYVSTFLMLGIPMMLGPMGEPGTVGFFYDGGWFFNFESIAPGAIVYWRSKKPDERVRQRSEATQSQPARAYSFRLEPMTAQQQQAVVTAAAELTIGAIMLYILYALAATAG